MSEKEYNKRFSITPLEFFSTLVIVFLVMMFIYFLFL